MEPQWLMQCCFFSFLKPDGFRSPRRCCCIDCEFILLSLSVWWCCTKLLPALLKVSTPIYIYSCWKGSAKSCTWSCRSTVELINQKIKFLMLYCETTKRKVGCEMTIIVTLMVFHYSHNCQKSAPVSNWPFDYDIALSSCEVHRPPDFWYLALLYFWCNIKKKKKKAGSGLGMRLIG